MIKIAIANDQPLIREALKLLFTRAPTPAVDFVLNSLLWKPVGIAGAFIKIDAAVVRVRLQLKEKPENKVLQKQLNSLIKAREKLLLELDRKSKTGIAHDNYKRT